KDNINSTMQLTVDVNGMAIRAGVDIVNNGTAREFCSAVDRGDICGMSFMFGIRKQRWDDLDSEHPTRYIEKISVVREVSGVTW
ncbi:HK97 family phage prohead protease, partial [[Clostridium] innocuum]